MLEVKQQIEAVMGDFEVMNTVVENCEKQLALAKMLYMGKIVIARSELSEQLDRMFRFFSRLELCGAVVNVIGNLHGMNVTVPFQDEDNLIPFYGIVSLALFVFVFIQVII
jgi:Mg2+ and Co2+ transporter CorA